MWELQKVAAQSNRHWLSMLAPTNPGTCTLPPKPLLELVKEEWLTRSTKQMSMRVLESKRNCLVWNLSTLNLMNNNPAISSEKKRLPNKLLEKRMRRLLKVRLTQKFCCSSSHCPPTP